MMKLSRILKSALFIVAIGLNAPACVPQAEGNTLESTHCDDANSLMWGLHWAKDLDPGVDLNKHKLSLLACDPKDPALKLVLLSAIATISMQHSEDGKRIQQGARYRDKITSQFVFEDLIRKRILKDAKQLQNEFDFETGDIAPETVALMEWHICNDYSDKRGLARCGTDFEPYRKRAELKFPKVRRSFFKGGITHIIGEPDQPGPPIP
ncbi:hypothetical protein GCM10011309_22280 [Litorimonas cladophorae]|uniref:Uncharacterized protein n=1 Tax=Litorimonas cladophorae TaxID=1220491 RepID=A0A918KRB2_9PROT|nr:hypothetical protein [Litorimonas cladophorae]GGX71615.1 hypothetical protein GCM10011309_22280 [Litorimonas cladophorae]